MTASRHRGISADWSAADYVIELKGGLPFLMESTPHTITPSQGVFRVETREATNTVWLTESPKPTLERVVGERRVSELDPEFRQFFTKQSLSGGHLLHQEYRTIKNVVRVPRKEVGFVDEDDMLSRLKAPQDTEVVIDETMEVEDKFAFIYRAKYPCVTPT